VPFVKYKLLYLKCTYITKNYYIERFNKAFKHKNVESQYLYWRNE